MSGPDWKGDYSLIRLGLYLQDHKKYSGGLIVKEGSHLSSDGKIGYIDSEVGDVVVWNLKTLHSGNAVRLKFFNKYSYLTYGKEDTISKFLIRKEKDERMAFFITFGIKSNHLDRYISEYMLKRDEVIHHLNVSKFDSNIDDQLKKKNVKLLRLTNNYGW